ncbi:hypothetical protein EGW08_009064 [Elysia chlorotica]|uniref:Ig-like domain-containing protein n=1 Tax=Elysia chlorotica TaxID=188477 RepID=A0A433TNL5_ELYCH|nr:hypothetical protein EGW08_009064 [Elysia chlorotica]
MGMRVSMTFTVSFLVPHISQAKISPAVATGLVYGSVRFRCSFDVQVSDDGITWYKGGDRLDLQDHPRLSSKGSELVISMIDRLDSGQYTCGVVYQNTTFISNEASLVIAGGPDIKPSSWSVPSISKTVEISCDVSGATTNHRFIWSRDDGSPITDPAVFTQIDTPIRTTLSFNFDGVRHSGVYVCKDVGSVDFQPYGKVGGSCLSSGTTNLWNEVLCVPKQPSRDALWRKMSSKVWIHQ